MQAPPTASTTAARNNGRIRSRKTSQAMPVTMTGVRLDRMVALATEVRAMP